MNTLRRHRGADQWPVKLPGAIRTELLENRIMLGDYKARQLVGLGSVWERTAVRLPERVSIDAVGIENTEDLVDDLMPDVRSVSKNHDALFLFG